MKHWRRGLWSALLWVLGATGAARAEQATLREYGAADGLETLSVHAAVQDGAGYLWVGTENGLYRFDGARFRRIGADQGLSWVNALAPQADGLWIGTPDGLWWWRDGKLVRILAADGQPLAIFGPGALAPSADGGLWAAASSGLHRVTPVPGGGWRAVRASSETERPPLSKVDGLLALSDGTLWAGCGNALCRLRSGHVERFGVGEGVPPATWDWLIRGRDGSVWARGGAHVLQLAPGSDRFVRHDDAGLSSDQAGFYPLAEDAQRRIVTATRGALLRWDGLRWERFGAASGLTFPGRVGALVADRDGGLWLGSLGAGMLQWRGYGQWENWSARDGLPSDEVWRFLRTGATTAQPLYVGTGRGVAVLDARQRRFRALASDASGAVDVGALAFDMRGTLWAGTWGGQVIRYAGPPSGRGKVQARIAKGDTVYGLLPDLPGQPLIVGLRQLYAWQPGAGDGMARPLEPDRVGKGGFGCACEGRDGQLWVGGASGLLNFKDGRWTHAPGRTGEVFHIACLRDSGLLVSDGYDGLHRITIDGDHATSADMTPPLLKGRQVLALLEDRRGWWWVTTDAGVAVSDGRHWRWLDQQAGLIWSDTTGDGLYEDVDGTIWIGTSRGASHVLAPETLFEPVRGKVFLEEVRSGSRAWRPSSAQDVFTVPWARDAIEVGLSAPVHRLRSAMRIEYRVMGFDDRWTAASSGTVRLAGLPPGAYRFEARVVDAELGVESAASGFGFEIAPPWWRTSLAYAIATLAVLGAGWLAHRWRVRQVTRHAVALEEVVRQRTRELEESRERLQELASRDGLTGAWNRRAVMEILARELGRAMRDRLPLTLLLADIDHFKRINDTFGHPAGDAVLREFVKRLAATVRPYDAVGRYGGEEFLIVLPGLDMSTDAQRLQALHAVIASEPMPEAGRVTCSFGVATLTPGMQANGDELIARADRALYQAKKNGRDRMEFAPASSG